MLSAKAKPRQLLCGSSGDLMTPTSQVFRAGGYVSSESQVLVASPGHCQKWICGDSWEKAIWPQKLGTLYKVPSKLFSGLESGLFRTRLCIQYILVQCDKNGGWRSVFEFRGENLTVLCYFCSGFYTTRRQIDGTSDRTISDSAECYAGLAYGGWVRSTCDSQKLGVLPKRHENSLFPSPLPKIKTMEKLFWPLLIIN